MKTFIMFVVGFVYFLKGKLTGEFKGKTIEEINSNLIKEIKLEKKKKDVLIEIKELRKELDSLNKEIDFANTNTDVFSLHDQLMEKYSWLKWFENNLDQDLANWDTLNKYCYLLSLSMDNLSKRLAYKLIEHKQNN